MPLHEKDVFVPSPHLGCCARLVGVTTVSILQCSKCGRAWTVFLFPFFLGEGGVIRSCFSTALIPTTIKRTLSLGRIFFLLPFYTALRSWTPLKHLKKFFKILKMTRKSGPQKNER